MITINEEIDKYGDDYDYKNRNVVNVKYRNDKMTTIKPLNMSMRELIKLMMSMNKKTAM